MGGAFFCGSLDLPVKDQFDQLWFHPDPIGAAIILGRDQVDQEIIWGIGHRQFLSKGHMPCRIMVQLGGNWRLRLGNLFLTEIIR